MANWLNDRNEFAMEIRKFQKKDINGLLPIYEDLGYPSSQTSLENRLSLLLSDPHYGCSLAEENGKIFGFIGYVKLYFLRRMDLIIEF